MFEELWCRMIIFTKQTSPYWLVSVCSKRYCDLISPFSYWPPSLDFQEFCSSGMEFTSTISLKEDKIFAKLNIPFHSFWSCTLC